MRRAPANRPQAIPEYRRRGQSARNPLLVPMNDPATRTLMLQVRTKRPIVLCDLPEQIGKRCFRGFGFEVIITRRGSALGIFSSRRNWGLVNFNVLIAPSYIYLRNGSAASRPELNYKLLTGAAQRTRTVVLSLGAMVKRPIG